MTKLKTGLGRGLDALINQHNLKDNYEPAKFAEIKKDDGKQVDVLAKIPVEYISSNPFSAKNDV